MYRANSKFVKTKVQNHVKKYYGIKALRDQVNYIKRHRVTNDYQVGKQLVRGGDFLIYNGDIKKFIKSLKLNNGNRNYSDDRSWELYQHLIGTAVQDMVKPKTKTKRKK